MGRASLCGVVQVVAEIRIGGVVVVVVVLAQCSFANKKEPNNNAMLTSGWPLRIWDQEIVLSGE